MPNLEHIGQFWNKLFKFKSFSIMNSQNKYIVKTPNKKQLHIVHDICRLCQQFKIRLVCLKITSSSSIR